MSKIAAIGRIGLVSVLAIITVIAAVGAYAYTYTSQMTTAKTTSNSAITTSTSWQVLKTNVTVRYDAGCMVFEAVGHTCPTKGANTTTSSLTGVELILYHGTDYYAGNFSAGPYGQTAVSYLTVWFTNTTIYCITPPKDNYPACP